MGERKGGGKSENGRRFSPKGVRGGSVTMGIHANKCCRTAGNGESIISVKSKLEDPEKMKFDSGKGSKQDAQESMKDRK